MMALLSTLAVLIAVASAQDRCDAPYPNVFCNTTEILAFESADCKPYHVFIARGSDEPYPGRQGNITREICSRIGSNDCNFESIQYPAKSTAWGKEEWCRSETQGQANGRTQMKSYAQKCPDAKLILLGYSQGGAVAQDILAGGGGKVFACEQPSAPALDAATGSKIVAAVTFGAVIRSRDQKFTIGPGVNFDGQRAHTPDQLEALNKYSDRLRDYCHNGDPMCAVGSTPVDVGQHLNYFLQHNEEVVSWVAEKATAKSSGGQVSEGKTPESSSSTSTSTSSSHSKPYPNPSPSPSSSEPTHNSPPPSSSERSSSLAQSNTPNPLPQPSPTRTVLPSSAPTSTNTILQSPSVTSAIAKSAAATPSIVGSATGTPGAQPAQSGNTASSNTGAANLLVLSPLVVVLAAAVILAIWEVI